MHKGKYAITCKLKYVEIFTRYSVPNMQEICTNMCIISPKYAQICILFADIFVICLNMHEGKYAIICIFKYAEICTKYSAICSTKYAGICTNKQKRNMQYMCIISINMQNIAKQNMHIYARIPYA